jgi:hypothetical protein
MVSRRLDKLSAGKYILLEGNEIFIQLRKQMMSVSNQ